MNKIVLYILIGIILGASFSAIAQDFTWWQSDNHDVSPAGNKTPEVQIWCELRSSRSGWQEFCKWNSKYWKLTCKGMERLFGTKILPADAGGYGCYDN